MVYGFSPIHAEVLTYRDPSRTFSWNFTLLLLKISQELISLFLFPRVFFIVTQVKLVSGQLTIDYCLGSIRIRWYQHLAHFTTQEMEGKASSLSK